MSVIWVEYQCFINNVDENVLLKRQNVVREEICLSLNDMTG